MSKLSTRLTELRGRRSLREMAQRTGLALATLSRIESGQRVPSIDTLVRLARGYGAKWVELVQLEIKDGEGRIRRPKKKREKDLYVP